MLTLLTFMEMCVLISGTRPRVQIGKDSSAFSAPPQHFLILLPELQFLNQNLSTSEKVGMCIPKGLTTKRGHFSMSIFVPSDCSTLRSGL